MLGWVMACIWHQLQTTIRRHNLEAEPCRLYCNFDSLCFQYGVVFDLSLAHRGGAAVPVLAQRSLPALATQPYRPMVVAVHSDPISTSW